MQREVWAVSETLPAPNLNLLLLGLLPSPFPQQNFPPSNAVRREIGANVQLAEGNVWC